MSQKAERPLGPDTAQRSPSGALVFEEENLGRDRGWHRCATVRLYRMNLSEHDLAPISAEHARALADRWRAYQPTRDDRPRAPDADD